MRVSPGPSRSRLNDLQTAIPAARAISKAQLLGAIFNWSMWIFLMFLMLSQLLTAVNNSTKSVTINLFGQHPSAGLYKIPGLNDEPYTDRAVVCVRYGKRYKAVLLSDALNSGNTIVEDITGSDVHGYRVVNRSGHGLNAKIKQGWTRTCRLIDSTFGYILTACESLGYTNLTHDDIRVVDGVSSQTTKRIPNSLPILIMPFYDNNPSARYAIPGWDGHACVFRLSGNYENAVVPRTYMFGVNRTIRETETIKWLNQPGGVWRNGWYEDRTGSKWYTDLLSTDSLNPFNVKARQFDPTAARELYCHDSSDCLQRTIDSRYADFHTSSDVSKLLSITISNGARYGLFYYRSVSVGVVECAYNFATFVSNASVIALLFRWMMAMVTLHEGHRKGLSAWHQANIGCIANSYSFAILPIAMLPRFKIILASFFTVGCQFEGSQIALADAWFVIYPSIVCLVLVYASLLNSLAKILRRRMSDITITPTILALSILHFSRIALAQTMLITGGRLSTLVSADEFAKLSTLDLFTPAMALRMGGNASSLLILKLVVLSIGLLPLLFSENMATQSRRSRSSRTCRIERTLMIRACNVGGIGQSNVYESYPGSPAPSLMLNAYELTRLGYMVFGGRYLMTFESWMVVTTTERMKRTYSLWNLRIMVLKVSDSSKETRSNVFQVSDHGQLFSLNDPAFNSLNWWDVDARPFL